MSDGWRSRPNDRLSIVGRPTRGLVGSVCAGYSRPMDQRVQGAILEPWPPLPFADWRDTLATLHLWTQVVGKVRLGQSPWTNHSWHVTLYVTPPGLTTLAIPHGPPAFSLEFDFLDHPPIARTTPRAPPPPP